MPLMDTTSSTRLKGNRLRSLKRPAGATAAESSSTWRNRERRRLRARRCGASMNCLRSSAPSTDKRRSNGLPYAVRSQGRSSPISESVAPAACLALIKQRNYEGDQLSPQPLGGVHPLPRRRSCLSVEQCGGTSLARRGARKKELDLRWFRCWWSSCRRRLHPDRNLQDKRRRSASLACGRA